MADEEAARRREIRRRKILEGSEARLRKITSSNTSKISDNDIKDCSKEEIKNEDKCTHFQSSESPVLESCKYDFSTIVDDNILIQRHHKTTHNDSNKFNGQFSGGDTFTTNGNFSHASSSNNYTFPKKVSDAETRSFGRTRCDVRRNSSCTQIMMETFQYTSFSCAVFRPWLTSVAAIFLRIYFYITTTLPAFETIFFPLAMLELTFSAWLQLESQIYNKPSEGHLFSGILLLCGLSETAISRVNYMLSIVNYIISDFAIYTFFFVLSHFVCEICM